ncbi:MAG: DUF4365 domain-containing protein [Chloroflexi bacterium]|nr:DUF4365 domain-containing protein [Chloroflexota bacterium]
MSYLTNMKMQSLHFAYVSAVVADAGHFCQPVSTDLGLDCLVHDWRYSEQRGYYDAGPAFSCQLKSSRENCRRTESHVIYRMKRKPYNKLVDWDGHQFAILIVFYMPKDKEMWFLQNEDIMSLRHCCYWTELTGGPIEKSAKNVEITRRRMFTSQTVIDLIARARGDRRSS